MRYNQPSIFLTLGVIGAGIPGAAVASAAAQIPCSYDVTVIQASPCFLFGPPVTTVTGVNECGHMCGYYWDCNESGVRHPFIWAPETGMVTIPLPPGIFSAMPADINDNDVICGTYSHGGFRGFVYDHGVWTELPPPFPQGRSDATAINNWGVVCGRRSIGPAITPYNAFIWNAKSGFIDLGVIDVISDASDITELGIVVGSTGGFFQPGQQGFEWNDGEVSILAEPGGSLYYTAVAISSQGSIVGAARYQQGQTSETFERPVFWNGREAILLAFVPGYESCVASDISDSGIVAGRCYNGLPGSTGNAIIWIKGVPHQLSDYTAPAPNQVISWATGINEAGQIMAHGKLAGYPVGLLLTPVHGSSADLNCDGQVNTLDLGILLVSWSIPSDTDGCGGTTFCPADLNSDGFVNTLDLGILLSSWTLR